MLNEEEIVMQFKQAKNPQRQVKILAELYGTTINKITDILFKHQVTTPNMLKANVEKKEPVVRVLTQQQIKAAELYKKGYNFSEIARTLSVSKSTISRWVKIGAIKITL